MRWQFVILVCVLIGSAAGCVESPKEPLPLKEVMELNKKPGLLAQLAEVRADSRGWFADD